MSYYIQCYYNVFRKLVFIYMYTAVSRVKSQGRRIEYFGKWQWV